MVTWPWTNKWSWSNWHKAASPPQTNGSLVFARWRQCGPDPPHKGAITVERTCPGNGHARWHSAMSCAKMAELTDLPFGLWTRVGRRKHKLNRICQVTTMCPHGGHQGTLASSGEYNSTCVSFGPPESTTQMANRFVQPFLHSSWQGVIGHVLSR